MLIGNYLKIAFAAGMLCLVPSVLNAEDSETWKPIGNGQIRDDIVTKSYILSSFYEFDVEMQESEQTPGRYRLVNAYKNCPSVGGGAYPEDAVNYLVVDASDPEHVYIEPGGTSYFIGEGQQLCVWSIADDYYNNKYGNWDLADEEGVCGKLKEGIITFPPGSVLTVPVEELVFVPDNHDFIWQMCNSSGKFRILLPGVPHTDIAISLMGITDDQTGVNYYMALDDGVESAVGALFKGEYTPEMAERICKTVDGTATDAQKVETVRVNSSGISTFPYSDDGIYTLVVVPYADGKAWPESSITSEFAYSEKEWKSIGKASYTEAILSSNELNSYGFVIEPYTFDVPVQQNVASPWLIRLVDPYGPDCYPYATSSNYDSSRHHYITFDLGDFNECMMLYTDDIGISIGKVGRISVWSYSDRGRNNDLSQAFIDIYYPDGLPSGKFDSVTNTLTFEKSALNIKCSANPTAWYAANRNGTFELKLPDGVKITEKPSGVAEIGADPDGTGAEYYTLSGIRVAGDFAPGIYLERKGGKSRKIMVK